MKYYDEAEARVALVTYCLASGLPADMINAQAMHVLEAVATGLVAAEGLPNEAVILASIKAGIEHHQRQRDKVAGIGKAFVLFGKPWTETCDGIHGAPACSSPECALRVRGPGEPPRG